MNRLQKLAGINSIKEVVLLASFRPEIFDKNNIPSNGISNGKPVILCMRTPFPMFKEDDYTDDKDAIPYTQVEFKKSLDEVFIDYDDSDLFEFGIDYDKLKKGLKDGFDNINKAYDEINKWESENKPYPVSNLEKYGLSFNEDFGWYGCYVNNIKPNEIISIKTIQP